MKFDLGTGEHHGLQTQSSEYPYDFWYISKDYEQNVLTLTNNPANCVPVKVENRVLVNLCYYLLFFLNGVFIWKYKQEVQWHWDSQCFFSRRKQNKPPT